MQTRFKGPPLEPIDPEIEASNRKRNAQRRLNQRIRVSSPAHRRPPSPIQRTPSPSPSPLPSPIQYEPPSPILMENEMENNHNEENNENEVNNENNNVEHPDPVVHQLLQQMAVMQRRLEVQNARAAPQPVQNLFAYSRGAGYFVLDKDIFFRFHSSQLTAVGGWTYQANWKMNTQAHLGRMASDPPQGRGFASQNPMRVGAHHIPRPEIPVEPLPTRDEKAEEQEEDEEDEEEAESSQPKRRRPVGRPSRDSQLSEIAAGIRSL